VVYSISDAVKESLDELTFLRSAITHDLLNYSALARFIQPAISAKLGYDAGIDAIAVAVRRYIQTYESKQKSGKLLEAVKNAKIILRSDLCLLVVRQWHDVDFLTELKAVLPEVDFRAGEKMYMLIRSNDLVIVCNSRFAPIIESKIRSPAKLVTKLRDLSVITINSQAVNFEVPGILQFFSQQFELGGINVEEVFSTRGKITFVFAQRDAAKAYERISTALEAVKTMPLSPR